MFLSWSKTIKHVICTPSVIKCKVQKNLRMHYFCTWGIKLTSHLQLLPRLRMHGAPPPHSSICLQGLHMDNFTFTAVLSFPQHYNLVFNVQFLNIFHINNFTWYTARLRVLSSKLMQIILTAPCNAAQFITKACPDGHSLCWKFCGRAVKNSAEYY